MEIEDSLGVNSFVIPWDSSNNIDCHSLNANPKTMCLITINFNIA